MGQVRELTQDLDQVLGRKLPGSTAALNQTRQSELAHRHLLSGAVMLLPAHGRSRITPGQRRQGNGGALGSPGETSTRFCGFAVFAVAFEAWLRRSGFTAMSSSLPVVGP